MGVNGVQLDFTPGVWDVAPADYHAEDGLVSHSRLETFRRSPRLYWQRHVLRCRPPEAPGPAMTLGLALHALVLMPEALPDVLALAPAVDRRTRAGREAWAEFLLSAIGKTVVDRGTMETARWMQDALRADPLARQLLEDPGRNELAIRWAHDGTGLPLKARFDRLLGGGVVVDLKTAADPSPEGFARQAAQWGYHRQEALYRVGCEEALGQRAEFVFVVVGSAEPHDVGVYGLDGEAVALGVRQNEADLARLYACGRAGRWEPPWAGQVREVALPRWAFGAGGGL